MRMWAVFLYWTIAGCQSATIGLTPPMPLAGGGGGTLTSADAACPVDAGQALETAIAGVADPIAQGTLQAQWQTMQELSGMASESTLEADVAEFTGLCASLASQGVISAARADELRRLAHCYTGV